jgi:hypothetical protein
LASAIASFGSPLLELTRPSEFYQATRVGLDWVPTSLLALWNLFLGSEVFPGVPPWPLMRLCVILSWPFALFQRMNPAATANAPTNGACSTCKARADCHRLLFPSTLSGIGSPPNQGLPHPVRSAFRVSYPLSGLLLPKPLNHLSGPSVLGICPSEFFSLQRAVPLSRPSALLPFFRRASWFTVAHRPRLQSVVPFEEAYSTHC